MFFYLSSGIQGAERNMYRWLDVRIGQRVRKFGNGVAFRKRPSSEQ